MGQVDTVLQRLGIALPAAPKPVASYVPFVRTGNLVVVSGQLPSKEGKVQFAGAVPTAVTIEQGIEAAKLCIINALAVLRDACDGDLDKVARIVRIGVFVQSSDGFDAQPKVANGASDLLVAVFGDAGKHARAAVGTNALPLNAAVEVELMAEVR
ncbi:MAG TPA: RidA family protein [Phycisphaerae bacterium]|nr:RidA family protein [Phycisphaerae bacterium]